MNVIVEFATICIDNLVGLVGKGRALRPTACQLLDIVLDKDPNNTDARCFKVEMLMPRNHYGKADRETQTYILVVPY